MEMVKPNPVVVFPLMVITRKNRYSNGSNVFGFFLEGILELHLWPIFKVFLLDFLWLVFAYTQDPTLGMCTHYLKAAVIHRCIQLLYVQ